MRSIALIAVATILLAGCSSGTSAPQAVMIYDTSEHHAPHLHESHLRTGVLTPSGQLVFIDGARSLSPQPEALQDPQAMKLTDYVRALTQRLVASSHYVTGETPIGVASFVPLDDLRTTNLFGMQIAESFSHEMQQQGFAIIDYKATGFIRITADGDYVYSRNVKELSKRLPIEYLLIGTFSETNDGMVVNARLVGAQSKVIVASAQQLIPADVFHSSVPKPTKRDGVLIIESRKQARVSKSTMMGERG